MNRSSQTPPLAQLASTLPRGPAKPKAPPGREAAIRMLDEAASRLGAGYATAAVAPLQGLLAGELDEPGWSQLFKSDLAGGDLANLVMDALSALDPQRDLPVTRALREVVCDYYDGFASDEDRAGVALARADRRPPLVLWTASSPTPYAYTRRQTGLLGMNCGLVAMPQAFNTAGVSAWCVVAHEAAGHGLLEGEPSLRAEAAGVVGEVLARLLPDMAAAIAPAGAAAQHQGEAAKWATYWPAVVEEALADVLGVLNQGPAAAGGAAVLFLRAQAADEVQAGPNHPHAALRLYVLAEAVRQTLLAPDHDVASAVDAAADELALTGDAAFVASLPLARAAARIVSRTLMGAPLACLGHKPLSGVQRWTADDEALADTLATTRAIPPEALRKDVYAAHVVAAAWRMAWTDDAAAFAWMVEALQALYARNPVFGPIPVELPGDLAPHRHSPRPPPTPPYPTSWIAARPPMPGPPPVPLPPIVWPRPPR